MKQLSSRWVAAVLLVPALLLLVISLVGLQSCGGKSSSASTTTDKGSVQIGFSGSISAPSGLTVQSLLLNVISVRVNPNTDPTISDADPNWQVIAAPTGTNAGQSVPTLTTGGSFGPNGNSVSFGMAQGELQIDLAQIQNTVTFFNTGLIKAEAYGQIELLLDSSTPGVVVPQCGRGLSTGEGCLSYPLVFSPNVTSIRTVNPFTVTRGSTQSLVLDISAQLGAGPVNSTAPISFTPSICAIPGSGGSASGCPGPPFTAISQDQISAVITNTVTGATAKTVVNAELAGTSTIVASSPVTNVNGSFQYTMVLPAPAPGGTASPALYDMFTTTTNMTQDPHASVPVFAGIFSGPQPAPDPFAFNITPRATKSLTGTILDACTGQGISGATIDLYVPATMVGTEDCTVSGAAPPCTTTCGEFVNNPNGSDISPGCVITGTASTMSTGVYPFPGSSTVPAAFSVIPAPESEDALVASASGFNGEILALDDINNLLQCPGSQFTKSNGQNPCNFSLQHGTLNVSADVDTSSGALLPTSNLNVMVNVEDHGTFNGAAVGMVTIPAGQASNSVAVPINVPISPPTPGAAMSTPTPVVTGGAASYDLFASVQDLFGSQPQKVSGHRIAVASDPQLLAAPTECGTISATVSGLACVGYGSIAGMILNPDVNSLVGVSKIDSATGDRVQLSSSQVPRVTFNPNFAICEPADTYIVSHDEAVPRSTPIAGASTSVTLVPPIVINSPPITATPTPAPCQGICSDFPGSNAGQSCLLCQSSGVIPNPL